jgi:uncharacterized protein (TIGR02246 family)
MTDPTGALEDRLRRLEDLQAIQQLFIDYGEHLDVGDFESYSQLFADDGEVLMGPMGRAKGPDQIRELMERQLGSKVGATFHVISSPRVAIDGDTATSTVMWTVVSRDANGQPLLTGLGHHIDDLTRTANGWRFQRRRGTIDVPSHLAPG